ncbi:hypothetical protein [Azospirillum endophyticum]
MAAVTWTIQSRGLTGDSPPLSEIVIGVEYIDTAHSYATAAWFVLTPDHPTATWRFDPGEAVSGTVFYQGILVPVTGAVQPFGPAAVTDGQTITVGSGVPVPFTLTIVPVQIDWSRVDRAEVKVAGATFTFTAGSTEAAFLGLRSPVYGWSAVYTLKDGSTYTTEASGSASPILLLPILPPVVDILFSIDPADFDRLPVKTVAVQVTSPGSTPQAVTLTRQSPGPHPARIFLSPAGRGWTRRYDYGYTVTYTPEVEKPAFVAPQAVDQTAPQVTLSELGVRRFAVVGAQSAIVGQITTTYKSLAITQSVTLPALLFASVGDYHPNAFSCIVTWSVNGTAAGANAFETGSYILAEPTPTPSYVEVAGDPFTLKTVVVSAPALSDGAQIQLALSSVENGNYGISNAKWEINGSQISARLTKAEPQVTYSFAAVDPEFAALSFPGSIRAGHTIRFGNAISSDDAITFAGHATPFSVTIDPVRVDWARVERVDVTLSADDWPDQPTEFVFDPRSGTQYQLWWDESGSGSAVSYSYRATYTLKGGTTSHDSGSGQTSPLLTLKPGDAS